MLINIISFLYQNILAKFFSIIQTANTINPSMKKSKINKTQFITENTYFKKVLSDLIHP